MVFYKIRLQVATTKKYPAKETYVVLLAKFIGLVRCSVQNMDLSVKDVFIHVTPWKNYL